MKTLSKSLLLSLAALCLAGSAEAKGRKAKPVVCLDYALVIDDKADGREVAVCYDKHVEGGLTLRYYTEITVLGPDGPARVVVGYR